MKNKVILFVPNDRLGGAEQYLKNIAKYYLERDSKVHVFFLTKSLTGDWNDLRGDIELHFTNSHVEKMGLICLFMNLLKINKKNILYIFTSHVHLTSLVGILKRLKVFNSSFFIARESTSIFKRFVGIRLLTFKLLYRLGYNHVNLLICQTEFMKNQLYLGMPNFFEKLNVKVIPNPISLDVKLMGDFIYREDNYIVSAGRLISEKGFDILISAFSRIKQENPQLKLIILGEGHLRIELENQIRSLNLHKDVILMGHVYDVYSYFKYAQVCVVSSRIEGFPNVLLQMMSQNQKVVSTLCAGGIEDLKGVVTCPTNSIEELHESIEFCLKNDLETRELFDEELESRSIKNFVKKVNDYLV